MGPPFFVGGRNVEVGSRPTGAMSAVGEGPRSRVVSECRRLNVPPMIALDRGTMLDASAPERKPPVRASLFVIAGVAKQFSAGPRRLDYFTTIAMTVAYQISGASHPQHPPPSSAGNRPAAANTRDRPRRTTINGCRAAAPSSGRSAGTFRHPPGSRRCSSGRPPRAGSPATASAKPDRQSRPPPPAPAAARPVPRP